jgi:Arc/MetJ family transcription regulator
MQAIGEIQLDIQITTEPTGSCTTKTLPIQILPASYQGFWPLQLTKIYISCLELSMRTNIVIDDVLMKQAMQASGDRSKRESLELALGTLVSTRRCLVDEKQATEYGVVEHKRGGCDRWVNPVPPGRSAANSPQVRRRSAADATSRSRRATSLP